MACLSLAFCANNDILGRDSKYLPKSIDMDIARDYILSGNGNWNPEIEKIVINDKYFKIGNEYLSNKDFFYESNLSVSPDNKNAGIKTVKLPNYTKALDYFLKSVSAFQNPVSAYEASYILRTIYGTRTDDAKKAALANITRILYQNGVCEAYIEYGKTLEAAKNKAAALAVYNEGLIRCKNNDWVSNVLAGKIAKLEKQ